MWGEIGVIKGIGECTLRLATHCPTPINSPGILSSTLSLSLLGLRQPASKFLERCSFIVGQAGLESVLQSAFLQCCFPTFS